MGSFNSTNDSNFLKILKIFIVEDEPLIVATLETILKKQGFQVLGDSDEYKDALQKIKTLSPNMVLLDIHLEGIKDGVDLSFELDNLNIPYLYLTSQTDPTTINRVKHTHPLGFIVKPFTEAGLLSNIELAWHNFTVTDEEFLLLRSEGNTHKIKQSTISHLKAFDNYCYVHTMTDRYLTPHTLKYIFEKLNPKNFIKVHRSYVANLNHISEIKKNSVLLGEEEIPLSTSKKPALFYALNNL